MRRDKTLNFGDFVIILLVAVPLIFAWTYTYDRATPLGSEAPSVLDDKHRETKSALQERLNVDHYWPLTGSQVSDAAAGQHRQIEFYGPLSTPTAATNKGWLYTKDVSSVVEFHWLDESGNELQITSGGNLYGPTGLTVPTGQGMQANTSDGSDDAVVKLSGGGSSTSSRGPVIQLFGNEHATSPGNLYLAPGDTGVIEVEHHRITEVLDPTAAQDAATKAYVDAVDTAKEDVLVTQATAGIFGAWTDKDSGGSNALVKDEVYKVGSDGFVCAQGGANDQIIIGYTDGSNPPTTSRRSSRISGSSHSGITFPVRKDDYWKVVAATGAIQWLPIGTGACVKQ